MRARRLRPQRFGRLSRSADLTGGGIALFLFQVKVLGSAMSLPFLYGPCDPQLTSTGTSPPLHSSVRRSGGRALPSRAGCGEVRESIIAIRRLFAGRSGNLTIRRLRRMELCGGVAGQLRYTPQIALNTTPEQLTRYLNYNEKGNDTPRRAGPTPPARNR